MVSNGVAAAAQPSLSWEDVTYSIAVPAVRAPAAKQGLASRVGAGLGLEAEQIEWKDILSGVTGSVLGGEMMAIMGPSGSGKTTLLHALAQRIGNSKTSRVSGQILLNGRVPSKAARKQCAFVFQDEIMLQHLTVRETVRFAALLRLPSTLTPKEIEARVDEVVHALSLDRAADTLVGNAASRGVSGGERKRTAIAVELVAQPKLLFLDEPTSGLDAATALNLGLTLRRISHRTDDLLILCSIHQPRLSLFELFSKLCLLRQGRMAYLGPQSQAVERLEGAMGGTICMPPRVSAPDWMLDVLTEMDAALLVRPGHSSDVEVATMQDDASSPAASDLENQVRDVEDDGIELVDKDGAVRHGLSPAEAQRLAGQLEAAAHKTAHEANGRGRQGEASNSPLAGNLSEQNSSLWQFRVLFQRQARQQRGEIFSGVYIFQILAVAVIASLVWLQSEDVSDILGVLFFINIQQSFNTMNGVLKVFPPERALMLRERDAGAYRVFPYFMAKSSSDFSSLFLFPVIYAVVIYFAVGLRDGAGHFFVYLALFLLAITTAQSLGLVVGAFIPSLVLANSVNFVLVLLIMLFGGFYVDVGNIPVWLRWIRYLSFMFWSYSGFVVNEFEGRELDCSNARPGEYAGNCREDATDEERAQGFNGDAVVDAFGFGDSAPWKSALVLIGMTIAFRILAYLCLRFRWTLIKKT